MFKTNNGGVNFLYQFCLGSISNKFSYSEAEEVSLKGNVYDYVNGLWDHCSWWYTLHSQVFDEKNGII